MISSSILDPKKCHDVARLRRNRRPLLGGLSVGAVVIAGSVTASAATYQVGPNRSHRTLRDVAGMLQPGDVVEVDGNATYEGGVIFERHGTSAQPITVRGVAVNGHRPVIDGGTNTLEAAGNHYVFDGLDITGGSSRCFYHHANDITVRDSVIHHCPQHGVLGADSGSGSLFLVHSEVHHCGSGTQKHQIYIATDESAFPGSVFQMDHCFVHDGNGGNNVKSRAERNEIRYNWIEGAMYHELELIGPDGQDPSLAREDSDVVGNVFFKRNGFYVIRFGGDGTGETDGRYRFLNNTVVVQPGGSAVFRLFDGIEALEVHNNIFASAGAGPIALLRDADANWVSGRHVLGYNNSVPPGSQALPPEWSATVVVDDPGFVDLGASDLRLGPSSPLVDAGVTVTSSVPGYSFPNPLARPEYVAAMHTCTPTNVGLERPDDGAPDLGAFEFVRAGGDPSGDSAGDTSGAADDPSGDSAGDTSGAADDPSGDSTGDTSGAADDPSGDSTGDTSGTADDPSSGSTEGAGGSPGEAGSGVSSGTSDSVGENVGPTPSTNSPDFELEEGQGIVCSMRRTDTKPSGTLIAMLAAVVALVARRKR